MKRWLGWGWVVAVLGASPGVAVSWSVDLRLRSVNNAAAALQGNQLREDEARLRLSTQVSKGRWRLDLLPFVVVTQRVSDPGLRRSAYADMLALLLSYRISDLWRVGIGRRQLRWGNERLLGTLNWHAIPRSFDGVFLEGNVQSWKTLAFAARPAARPRWQGGWRGHALQSDRKQSLLGLGVGYEGSPWHLKSALFRWRKKPGRDVLLWDLSFSSMPEQGLWLMAEYAHELGQWSARQAMRAYAWSVQLGWRMSQMQFSVAYDFGTGGETAGIQRSFVFPFHTNHRHYGEMDLFSWGNLRMQALRLSRSLGSEVRLRLGLYAFQLANPQGPWLDVTGLHVFAASAPGVTAVDAGKAIELRCDFPLGSWQVSVFGGWFAAGAAARARGLRNAAASAYLLLKRSW